jgi:M6 family metalloprotease-like protein
MAKYLWFMSRKALLTIFLMIFALITPTASFAAPKAGASCPKAGISESLGNKRFTCIKSGKKLIWNKGVSVAKPLGAPSAPSPNPTPESPKETVTVYPVTSRDSFSKLETCMIKTTLTGSEGVGFPRSSTAIPSLGTVKGVTLFVEFPDLKDDGNPLRVWRTQQVPTAEQYYKTASYGKLVFKVDLVEKVYVINKSVLTYNLDTHHDAPAKPNAKPWELVLDAMTAADSDVDFSKYDYVNVVTPATTMIGFEGAIGLQHTYDGKLMQRATFGPIREYVDSPPKYNWLVHETGHLLGLLHPYSYKNPGYVIPTWDLMGDSPTENPEFLAWHKFLLGWLDAGQVNNGPGVKTTIVKLSETQALVLENRRKSSLNAIEENQAGVVAYLVDGTVKPGEGAVTILFAKFTATRQNRLIGTLKPGESIKHQNVTVKVLSSTGPGDYVSVVID